MIRKEDAPADFNREQKYLDDKYASTKEGKAEKEKNIKEGLSKLTDENLKFILEMNPDPAAQKMIKDILDAKKKEEDTKQIQEFVDSLTSALEYEETYGDPKGVKKIQVALDKANKMLEKAKK
jgi:hypothetical protein